MVASLETNQESAAYHRSKIYDTVRLAWSNLAAQSGEQIALAAAPIIAVLALGAGVAETGLLQTALTLPFVLLAIPSGLLADRYPRCRADPVGHRHHHVAANRNAARPARARLGDQHHGLRRAPSRARPWVR
jgi:MFS family permease